MLAKKNSLPKDDSIIAFCHIVKAAGTTFSDILRRNYGLTHLDVEPGSHQECYDYRSLSRDLKLMPWLKSLAGHGLRPHVDYQHYNSRLKWITWLRDPVKRLISGYQHGVEKNGLQTDFGQWLTEPGHRNRQVYFLTGDSEDLEGAKAILRDKFVFVGFVEQFDPGLDALAKVTNNLDVRYTKIANPAKTGSTAKFIYQNYESYRNLIDENTRVDKLLYDWALEHFTTNQNYRPSPAKAHASHYLQTWNRNSNFIFRHVAYKHFISKL